MKLTATRVAETKAQKDDRKYSDGGGLYLLVTAKGGKLWRYNYRFNGKQRTFAIGKYPEISLKQARNIHQVARSNLANGIDPSQEKKNQKRERAQSTANTFGAVALDWAEQKLSGLSSATIKRNKSIMKLHLLPGLADRPISEISPPEVLAILRISESRGAIETPRRAKSIAGQIFRYGVATGRCERDPTVDIRDALKPTVSTHYGALVEPKSVGRFIRAIHEYHGGPVVKAALLISAFTFQRPGNIRSMEWQEVSNEQWVIPASKSKTRHSIVVPLSRQARSTLSEIAPLTWNGRYVFPSERRAGRPLSDGGVRVAIRSMGYERSEMTAHGFRAMDRTLLDEVLLQRLEWIEMQLGHRVRDVHGRAYNRTQFLNERREMMQRWADYLDRICLECGGEVYKGMRGRS